MLILDAPRLTLLAQVACGFMRQLLWSPDGAILALSHQGGVWLWEQGFGRTPTRRLETDGVPVGTTGRVVRADNSHTEGGRLALVIR